MNPRFLAACALFFPLSLSAPAQTKPNSTDQRQILEQILMQTYQPSEVGKRLMGVGSDADVRKPGTIVVVQREGLYGSLNRNEIASSAIGNDAQAKLYRGHQDYAVPAGERFYVAVVAVGSSAVNFGLLSARPISTPKGTGRVWTALAFNFPEATLADADKDTVMRALDQWFVPEGRSSMSPAPMPAKPLTAASARPLEQSPAPVAPLPQPIAVPATLAPGMSRDRVIELLGKPQSEVNFQSQTWLHFSGMVAILQDGKLVTVEQSSASAARVALLSDPDGAEIYLDGQLAGSTPSTLQIPAGNHQLSIKLAGYQDWTRNLHVLPGSEINFAPKLAKQ